MDIQIIQSLDQSVVEEQLQKRRAVANAASTNAATDTTTTSAVQTSQQTQNFSQVLETATKAAAALAIDSLVAASNTGAVNVSTVQSFFDQHGININLSDSNSVASALTAGASAISNAVNTISENTGALICPDELNQYFEEAASAFGVDVKLLKAIAKQESNFTADAVSSSGAVGIMQLMPQTAQSLGVTDSYDACQNIMGGAKYISSLLSKYNGDVSLALAAYNAGSGNVAKYGGIPPFTETQNYVTKVLAYYNA